MLMEEYSEAEVMELFRKEGRAEGREEGLAEGRAEGREEGLVEGRAEGREEGRAEGREEGIGISRLADIRNIMAGLNMSPQQAMNILKIPVDDRRKYIELLD